MGMHHDGTWTPNECGYQATQLFLEQLNKLHQLRPQTTEKNMPFAPPGFHNPTPKASNLVPRRE